MRYHKISNADFELSELALGCMSMTPMYGRPDREESIASVHRAVELGINHIDTSDAYAFGANEELLALALEGKREKMIVASKFGQVISRDGSRYINGKPDYVRSACEASLKRLKIDHIDLYYQHRVDPNVPIEDTIGAMAELKQAGKIGAIGLSEAAPKTIRAAHKVHPIAALQTEYSLWTRMVEDEHLALCRELGIAFIAYSPMGRGFLTGEIRSVDDLGAQSDWRVNHPRFAPENIERNLSLLHPIENMAKAKGCTMAQIAIAWVNGAGDDVFALAGSAKRTHLEENVKALDIELSPAERAELSSSVHADEASGERYPPGMIEAVNV